MAGALDAADLTELAGIAEMRTESVQAWSLEEADEDYPLIGSWEDPDWGLIPRRIPESTRAAPTVEVEAEAGVAQYVLDLDGPVVQPGGTHGDEQA